MERLSAAGIRVAVSLAPIIPGITDAPEQIESVIRAAAEHGATDAWAGALRLAPGVKEHFLETIEHHFRHLSPTYGRLYGGGAYAPTSYQLRAESLVSTSRRGAGMARDNTDAARRTTSFTSRPPVVQRGQLALPI
jgi:DNA repair photolyase